MEKTEVPEVAGLSIKEKAEVPEVASLEKAEQPDGETVVQFDQESHCNPEQLEYTKKLIALNGKVTVMVAGKPRMGKSTALNNLFGLSLTAAPGARSVTTVVLESTTSQNGVQVRYIDTPGLEAVDNVDSEKVMADMKLQIGQGDDSFTLLYCISAVNSFDQTDVKIIKNLTKLFGAGIWKRCVLVLTRCDTVRSDDFEAEAQVQKYKECLSSYVVTFKEILEKCKIQVPPTKLIFDCQDGADTYDAVVAVPVAKSTRVGREPSILPGFNIDGSLNWSDYVFLEVLKKAGKLSAISLIKLRYNLYAVAGSTAGGALVGAGSGAAVGGKLGAVLGLVAGPAGVAAGSLSGAAAGALTGAIVGSVGSFSISAIVSGLVAALQYRWKKDNERITI